MIHGLALLMAAGALGDAPAGALPSWSVVVEGTLAELATARAEMARCRFSRIEIVPIGGGRGRLRIPTGEMLPRRAICLNDVADTLALPGLRWTGPDLRRR